MKYLKIYEAFESATLSKVVSYVSSKVDKQSVNRFINRLKKIQEELDIPISKIAEKDVKYLSRVKALNFRNKEDVYNSRGIYCLKFWFSLNEGFLGFTSTGNKVYKYGVRKRREKEKLDNTDVEYIKNILNIKTGKLKHVENYTEIQHGQLVVGLFSDDYEDLDRLSLAKIWREGDRIFAIQNVAEGGTPDNTVDGERWHDWRDERFRYSWSLGDVDTPGDDHHKLYFYEPSDEPLNVIGFKEEEKIESENPLDYNLPLNSRFNVGSWNEYDWSIESEENIKRSDFAVILILDDVLKSELKSVTLTQKERQISRVGATKLISDEEIRNTNIERYMTKIIKGMIDIDTSEIKNLQKIIQNCICGDFAFISIWKDKPSLDYLGEMSNLLYSAISEEDKEYYLKKAVDVYKRLLKSNNETYKIYVESMEKAKNHFDKEQVKDFFDTVIRMGKKIKEYVASQKIENIEDIRMFQVKFKSIRMITREREFELESYIRNLLSEFNYPNDVDYYLNEYGDRDITKDLKRIKQVERYVDSILR